MSIKLTKMTLNFTSQVIKKEHHLTQLCLSDSAKK